MERSVVHACRPDLRSGDAPAGCVLDCGRADMCVSADGIIRREQCLWWREAEGGARGSRDMDSPQETYGTCSAATIGDGPVGGADRGGTSRMHSGRPDKRALQQIEPHAMQHVSSGERKPEPPKRSPRKPALP